DARLRRLRRRAGRRDRQRQLSRSRAANRVRCVPHHRDARVSGSGSVHPYSAASAATALAVCSNQGSLDVCYAVVLPSGEGKDATGPRPRPASAPLRGRRWARFVAAACAIASVVPMVPAAALADTVGLALPTTPDLQFPSPQTPAPSAAMHLAPPTAAA